MFRVMIRFVRQSVLCYCSKFVELAAPLDFLALLLRVSFLRTVLSRSLRLSWRRVSPSYALIFHASIRFIRGPSMKRWTMKPRSMQKTKLKASR